MAGNFDKIMKKQNLGSGLLSENSRQFAVNEFKVTYIPLTDLIPNRNNDGFSMQDIEELKTSIREVGLEQNLVVVPEGLKFRILTGHRRFIALQQLFEEGMEKFRTVPCIVKDLGKIDLPLSAESKELYAIATTNVENRRFTDGDKLKMMEMLSRVYDELRDNGYEKLGKRRDFLAERLGISSASVQILNYVDRNLDDSFREAFLTERIPLMVANEIAHMPKEAQQDYRYYVDVKGISGIGVKDVRKFAEQWKKEHTAKKILPAQKPQTELYRSIQTQLLQVVNAMEQCPTVTGEDAEKLNRLQQELKEKVATVEKIMKKYGIN